MKQLLAMRAEDKRRMLEDAAHLLHFKQQMEHSLKLPYESLEDRFRRMGLAGGEDCPIVLKLPRRRA